MKKRYQTPEVEIVKCAPEILEGLSPNSVGTTGTVTGTTGTDTGTGWDFAGTGGTGQSVDGKAYNPWSSWDD